MKQKLKTIGKHSLNVFVASVVFFAIFAIWEIIGLLHQLAIYIINLPFK